MSDPRPNFAQDPDWTYEKQLAKELHDLLESADTPLLENNRPSTYENSGILSYNQGVVIRLEDGAEYQLTLVCSKNVITDRCQFCMRLLPVEDAACDNEECSAYGQEFIDDEVEDNHG